MAVEVIIPKFGFTQETATIVRWLVHEGEKVDAGDPILEVTTDKVNMEVETPVGGILAGICHQEGETVPVTQVVAYVLAPGEKLPAGPVDTDGAGSAAEPVVQQVPGRQVRSKVTPVAGQLAKELGIDPANLEGSGPGGWVTRADVENFTKLTPPTDGKVRATPAARRMARERGVELREVAGSGPRGRIQGEDVRSYAEPARTAKPVPQQAPVPAELSSESGTGLSALTSRQPEIVPLSNIRRTIADRLQRSAQEAPHIYLEADIDATAIEALRRRANAGLAEGQPRVSLTVLLLRFVGWALRRHPMLNSRLEGNNILLLPDLNLGVAVALDSGLIVPVIREVERKSLAQLASELDELVARARGNRLRPEDVADGSFTISNLGMFGVDRFTAILNPPQTGILAVGRINRVFVPDENDRPVVRPSMTVTLGADHRVVDGAIAAKFLAELRDCIEHPEMLAL